MLNFNCVKIIGGTQVLILKGVGMTNGTRSVRPLSPSDGHKWFCGDLF